MSGQCRCGRQNAGMEDTINGALQVMGRTDRYIETTKQVAQIGAGPAIARSDTMLNTHGEREKYE